MSNSKKTNSLEELNIPEEFFKIINDFIFDIKTTFPEYIGIINYWWNEKLLKEESQKQMLFVFKHCIKIFPERFFDILYKNNDIFLDSNDLNTEFLPGIVFRQLWNLNISDKTRETIWKYLQLILFSVIGSVKDTSQFGDTAKMFESINEDELKIKLQEALEEMQKLFEKTNNKDEIPNIPKAEDINNHIQEMMHGKLGKLAMELAEETAEDLNLDLENITSSQEVFQKLFSNPGKLMNVVKNVGGKIDAKVKSGEIKESELISEGIDLLNKMKNMPGMENMKDVFAKLGIPGLGSKDKNSTEDFSSIETKLNNNLKKAQMKENYKENNKENNKDKKNSTTKINNSENKENMLPKYSEEELISIFNSESKDSINKKKKKISKNK